MDVFVLSWRNDDEIQPDDALFSNGVYATLDAAKAAAAEIADEWFGDPEDDEVPTTELAEWEQTKAGDTDEWWSSIPSSEDPPEWQSTIATFRIARQQL